ncbi:MAG: glycoside hydrolase family 38 C-terminal domain-containing protein, partial [Planctomycetota bacterium]
MYEWAASIDPGLGERIDQRLHEGRWECEGAAYVEFDSNLPCGEGLLRSLLIGQDITRAHAGEPGRILWLPDTFGFNACLPQLMRLCGVDGFWTTKLHWNAITHFPHTSFRWRSNDGSQVLAHLAQHYMGYMTDGSPTQLNNIEMIHRQSDVHGEAVAPVGFGDGGGGITAEQIERVHRCANLHGTPRTHFGRVADFFGRLQELAPQLPSYDGELYLEYHRGVLTSRRDIKRSYRALERALQSWEAVRVARGGGVIDHHFWKRCCLMQFHDILPGTGIGPAMADCVEEMEQLAGQALDVATSELANDAEEDCLFNPLPQPQRMLLADGRLLELPPLTGRSLDSAAAAPAAVQAAADRLDNGRVHLRLDEQGCIAALTVDGHAIRQQGPLAAPWLCTEMPTAFPVWEIEQQSLSGGRLLDGPARLRVERHTDGSASLHAERSCGRHSSIVTSYRLQPEESLLRISVSVDWQEAEALLQLHFPTAYRGRMARFGCPYGSVLRTQLPGMPHEQAQWEVAGSRWAAVCDDGEAEGLFLVTRDHYGFSCRAGTLTCSLVRSPVSPDCEVGELGRVLLGAGDAYGGQEVETLLTDLGPHRCELAIGHYNAHAGIATHPAALADSLFTPCLPYRGRALSSALLGCEGDAAVVPAWAQPLDERAWLLRLHEVAGRHGSLALRL